MHNFEHEVDNIEDRYLRYFVAADYFHDGVVQEARFVNDGRDLELTVSCEREWRQDWREHWSQDGRMSQEALDHEFDAKYMYRLRFRDCYHYCSELIYSQPEYISGRFKNSVRVAQAQQATGKRHLHLRIQYADGGYADVIFRRFSISRAEGEICLPPRVPSLVPFWIAGRICRGLSAEELRERAASGDWLQKSCAIERLACIGDRTCVPFALAGLESDDEDVRIASVYALGVHGDATALPQLAALWRTADYPIARRHIQDAIEKILYRRGAVPEGAHT